MTTIRLLLAIFFSTFLTLGAEETYEIRLHRPMKAGDRFRIAAKIAIEAETATTFNNKDPDVEKVSAACKLTGELSVVAVTPKGLVSEMSLKLEKVECMTAGVKSAFFKTGDIIHLRQDGADKVAEVNGESPDETQNAVIDDLLSVANNNEPTEDEVSGTQEKVKIGAEWALRADVAAKAWSEYGYEGLKAQDIKGSTKLTDVGTLGGKPSLRLSGELKISNSGMKMPDNPEELKTVKFSLEANDETEIPVDPAAMEARVKLQVKLESESSGKIEINGEAVNINIKVHHRYAYEIAETPIP